MMKQDSAKPQPNEKNSPTFITATEVEIKSLSEIDDYKNQLIAIVN